jgi:hypothetical protein
MFIKFYRDKDIQRAFKYLKMPNTSIKYFLYIIILLYLVIVSGCDTADNRQPAITASSYQASQVIPVHVETTPSGFRLVREGKVFHIRGAGGLQYYDRLKDAGGNSVRLWSTDYAGPLLDAAHQQGLTVMLGLWLPTERQGFSYHNRKARAQQLQRLRMQVLQYRYHPALLMWNIGNELDQLDADPSIYKAVEEIAQMIHELDPYHPVATSTLPYLGMVSALVKFAPSVDILGVNAYKDLGVLPSWVRARGWNGPYIVTEFGGKGYWETQQTPWNAPLEQTSSAKAEFATELYKRSVLTDTSRCLGAYAFYWGHKFEITPTWFSMFEATGEKTAFVDELYKAWRGEYPINRVPYLSFVQLNGKYDTDSVRLQLNTEYPAVATAFDPENDTLTTTWEIRLEDGKDIVGVDSLIRNSQEALSVHRQKGLKVSIRTPQLPGAYRLYVRVFDGHGNVATGNIPFYAGAEPKKRN